MTTTQYEELKSRINAEVSRRSVLSTSNPAQGTPAPKPEKLVRQRSINTTDVPLEMTDATVQPTKGQQVMAAEGDNVLGKLTKIGAVLDAQYNSHFQSGKPIPAAFNYEVLSKWLDELGAKPAEAELLNTGCNGACVGLCVSSCYSLCTGYFTFNVNFFSDFFSSFGGDFGGSSDHKIATNPKPVMTDDRRKDGRFVNFNNFGADIMETQAFNASSSGAFNTSDFSTAFAVNTSASGKVSRTFSYDFTSGFSSRGDGGFKTNDVGEPTITDDFVTDFATNTFFNVFSGDSLNAFSGDFQSDFTAADVTGFSNDTSANTFTKPAVKPEGATQFVGDFANAFAGNKAFSGDTTQFAGFKTNEFSGNFGGDFNGNTNADWQGPGTTFSGDFRQNFSGNAAYGFTDFAGSSNTEFIGDTTKVFHNEAFLGNTILNDDPNQFSADSYEDRGGSVFSTNFSGNFTTHFTYNFFSDFFSSFFDDFTDNFTTDFSGQFSGQFSGEFTNEFHDCTSDWGFEVDDFADCGDFHDFCSYTDGDFSGSFVDCTDPR